AAERVAPRLRHHADLADRVRLPDEPARPLRRRALAPGEVRRGLVAAREAGPLRGRADPLHDEGRAAALRLAERLLHRRRDRQVRLLLVPAPDRGVLAPRPAHDDLWPGA